MKHNVNRYINKIKNICMFTKIDQLHAVSRSEQGRHRGPRVKTPHIFRRILGGGTQRRALTHDFYSHTLVPLRLHWHPYLLLKKNVF